MKSRYLLFGMALLVASSCSKKPDICFTADKTTVFPKDTITFKNCSERAEHFKWEFGDGMFLKKEEVQYAYQDTGVYVVTLSADPKNFLRRKTYSDTLTIHVIKKIHGCRDPLATNYHPEANVDDGSCAYPGSKTFWTDNPAYASIDVKVNNVLAGTVQYVSATEPDCENGAGSLKVTKGDGLYTYDAVYYNNVGIIVKTYAGAFQIKEGVCELFKMK